MQAENLAQAANLIWGFDPKVIATAIVVVATSSYSLKN